MKIKLKIKQLTGVGSGVSRSSSEGLVGVAREFEVLRDARDGASESLHCSTSTSTSSSTSGKRSTDMGPNKKSKYLKLITVEVL